MNEDRHSERNLFDFALEPPPAGAAPEGERDDGPEFESLLVHPETLPLFTEEEIEHHLSERLELPAHHHVVMPSRPRRVPDPAPEPARAALGARLRGTATDLVVLAAAGMSAAVGANGLEVEVGTAQLAPLALFVVSFSFLYFVVPLAFWGGTPGMLWAGLVARNAVTEPLSFGQTVLRWLGTWLTWLLAGLPGLLALTGRSLVDRLSGSTTYAQPAARR